MADEVPIIAEVAEEKIDPATLLQNKYVPEETLKRISSHKGIVGIILADSLGIPIRSSMDRATTLQYAKYVSLIAIKSRKLMLDLEPTDSMTLLRVRTKVHELIVVPSNDYCVIVVQKVVLDSVK